MNRRKFLYFSSLVIFIPITNFGWKYYESNPLICPKQLMKFCDPYEIAEVGKKYIQFMPLEKMKDNLRKLLLINTDGIDYSGYNKIAIEKMIQEKVKSEYVHSKIVIINGWVLSITEAQQCALFSIT